MSIIKNVKQGSYIQLSKLWAKMPMKAGEKYPLTSEAKDINCSY